MQPYELDDTVLRPEGQSMHRSVDSTVPGESPKITIEGYEVLRELGHGSMGHVYLARQGAIGGRLVALKVASRARQGSTRLLARFQQEIQAIGLLQHPSIVQIYGAGECSEGYFFAMEYVDGCSLEDLLEVPGAVTARQAAELICECARAMSYAHERGVIHRDIKPGNILRASDGRPKIVDFGLAHVSAYDQSLTHQGDLIGTPAYMSPEQARGRGCDAGVATDIYSLCAVLYHLICGVRPFQGSDGLETIAHVVKREPIAPRKHNSDIPIDLETICLKGMQKSPAHRYVSTLALAEDLERFLRGEPILARRISAFERSYRWVRRNPVISFAACLVLASLFAVMAMVAVRWYEQGQENLRRVTQEKQFLEEQAKRKEAESQAEEIATAVQETAYRGAITQASHQVMSDSALAKRTLGSVPAALKNRWEFRHLSYRCNREAFVYQEHDRAVWSVAYSPSGTRVASVASGLHTLRVWDAEDGTLIRQWTASETLDARWVAFVSEEAVATASADGVIRVFSCEGGTFKEVAASGHVLSFAVSRDGNSIAVGTLEGVVTVFDRTMLSRSVKFMHGSPVTALAFTHDGSTILSGGSGSINVWSVMSNDMLNKIPHPGVVRTIAVHQSGNRIFSAGDTKTIYAWTMKGEQLFAVAGHTQKVWSVALTSDGKRLISGGGDKVIRVWEADTGDSLFALPGHEAGVVSIVSHPTVMRVASAGSTDTTVRVWDVSGDDFTGHTGTLTCVASHPTQPLIATGSRDASILLWNEWKQQVRKFQHSSPITCVAFTSDGARLVSGTDDGTVRVWDIGEGACIATGMVGAPVRSVAVHSQEDVMLSGGDDGTLRRWQIEGTTLVVKSEIRIPKLRIWSLCFLQDGTAVFGGDDGGVRSWKAQDVSTLYSHTGPVRALMPFGKKLLSGASDGILMWDGQVAQKFSSEIGQVMSIVQTSDGERVFTAEPHSIRVWDVATNTEMLAIPVSGAVALTISPEGHLFFVGQGTTLRTVRIK